MPAAKARAWVLILLMGSAPVMAANDAEQRQIEAQLLEVQSAINALSKQLRESREDLGKQQQRLRETDLAIQTASKEYRRLQTESDRHSAELESLQEERDRFLANLDERMQDLGEQIRSSYQAGSQSRLKLLLNQDEPAAVGRMIAYYEYLNQAQLERIAELRLALAGLEEVQLSIQQELDRLSELQAAQKVVLDQLETQRADRESVMARLAQQVDSEEARLAELQKNREDLQALIEQLTDALADIPADLDETQRISQHKGQLPMPLNGKVRHAFGQKRSGSLRWQGWLIAAEPGNEAKAIAHGRVVFADWLRGYGLLLIIDHGEGYMSLYGNNESLLQEVGAWVSPNDAISIVGSNPGGNQGLFFELRKNGKAIDPAGWIRRR